MHYHLKVLILGDPDTIHFYASRAFGEPGEDKDTYFEWYREVKVLEDTCSLEIDAVTSISADLDEILKIVDGIVYFLNPLNEVESELFEMVLPDIFDVKRDIPTVVNFYDQNGILPLSVNELLTRTWVSYPSLEAFVNLKPNEFHQALESLCLAIINGDTPLNIENAWMRFPIFIQMANVYYNNKNYYYAAQAVKKAALIAEIYNRQDYYIMLDQAAFLFSKINLYLEAGEMTEKIDKRKTQNFKKLYADAMIIEGNISFNKQDFEKAASQYERAAQWASINGLDDKLVKSAFELAINAWVSACKVENTFRILENLLHEDALNILNDITEKIVAAADYLIKKNNFELAKEQLYRAIDKYQIETLSDKLKYLTHELTEILIKYFKNQVEVGEIYAAKYTYDEIENMWDSYNVERTDLDSTLKLLITAFLEKNNFRIAAILINKLNSSTLKKELSKLSAELEEKYKDSVKKEIQEYIKKGEEIVAEFVNAEFEIISDMNKKQLKDIEPFIKQNKHLKAGNQILNHANYLKKIGKESINDQILSKALDIFLDGEIFNEFFITFNNLSKDMKEKYLNRIFPIFLDKLKGIEKSDDYERKEQIFENSNRIYRTHLLYDKSKEISLEFIKNIKKEALAILNDEENNFRINRANELVKKATDILDSYLDREERVQVNFDEIYKKIAEIYIELGDLHSAHVYNDRIENRTDNTEIHNRIAELESKESEARLTIVEDSREEEVLKEQFSIMEKKAREYYLDRDKYFRERRALKRAYYQEALNHLTNQEFEESTHLYIRSITKLNNIKKYDLAGVSLTVVILLLIKENRFSEINKILEEIKEELSGLWESFSKTFPVELSEYIIKLRKYQDEFKVKRALSFLEKFPLFEEELHILSDYLLIEETSEEEILEEETEDLPSREERGVQSKKKVEMGQIYGKLESMMGDVRREKNDLVSKRRAQKRLYYKDILNMLETQKFKETASKYFKLAISLSRRGDLEKSSLLILLHGLCLLKEEESYTLVKKNIEEFLNGLGINKKLVKDTYPVMLILFIIDVKNFSLDEYIPKFKGMIEILPLFEEEEQLIDLQ
ncbi:MAG: hypothetical protein ACW98D_10700 [Promethearchaeota archaeon]|jgi:hypothetical protein